MSSPGPAASSTRVSIPPDLKRDYADLFNPQTVAALTALAEFNPQQKELMAARVERRRQRFRDQQPISFLPDDAVIPRTQIKVQDARAGRFVGSEIPGDLQRQWIQGTGPAAKPNATVESSIRNVAYALLSGADGWMFDGEDALGQIKSMSLDNQRNLKLAIHQDLVFMQTARRVASEMNRWAESFHGHAIIDDWQAQLEFTTKIFRARGLHLDDRHLRDHRGNSFSASIVDLTLYVVNNYQRLQQDGSSIVLYLPKIQTAEEAAFWNEMLTALESHLGLGVGTIKVYVLVEQFEATFQLMEIRAALGKHFVGYNTGRWDYINSVADALAWNEDFINPNIDAITMTYGYMAQLRRPRAPRREHAGRRRALCPLARRHGTEHSGRFARGRRQQHAQGGRGRRAGTARRGQRKNGSPTGKWCISCAPCGRRWATTISWGANFPV